MRIGIDIDDTSVSISESFDEVRKKHNINFFKKLNIDLMIDDSRFVYDNMKNDGIDCILFGDKIKTWEEVLEYIREKEE